MKQIILIFSLAIFFPLQGMNPDIASHKQTSLQANQWLIDDESFKCICTTGAANLCPLNFKKLLEGIDHISAQAKTMTFSFEEKKQAFIRYQIEELLKSRDLNLSAASKELLMHPLHNNNLIQITSRAHWLMISKRDIAKLQDFFMRIFGSEKIFYQVRKFIRGLTEYKIDIIKECLESDFPINAIVSPSGETPFIAAVCNGWEELVENLLLNPAIDINAQELEGEFSDHAALHHAVINEDEFMVKLLLACPTLNIDLQTYNGDSAVMLASKFGYTRILTMILEKFPNADLSLTNINGCTALELASTIEIKKILEGYEDFR